MKLIASTEKAAIKWFYYVNGQKYRMTKGMLDIKAWDVECSCGWKSSTGGGVKSWLDELVFEHKYVDHDYKVA